MHDDVANDMISSLPDEALTHILSFLSTKEAVRTHILSKRWSNLWAYVPVLKFDLREFWTYDPHTDNEAEKKECENKFRRFVNGVLENRVPSCLDTFEYFWLSVNSYHDTSLEWLDRVVALMPRVILVYIQSNNLLILPDSVFSCASLQKLTLCIYNSTIDRTFITPELFNLPSLNDLDLGHVKLADDFTQKLFLVCPALESLSLADCDSGISDITSDVLKKFVIYDCWLTRQLRISCPGLVSLFIQSPVQSGGISLWNMPSLENAVIKLYEIDYYLGDLPIQNVLNSISNATTIELYFEDSLQLKELLKKDIPRCRIFNNLKSLEFGEWDMTNEFDLVSCWLEHSPNLQKLTLHLSKMSQGITAEQPREDVLFQHKYLEKEALDKDVPNWSIFKNLKSLQIRGWGISNNFDLIAFFFHNSPNLRELTLHLYESSNDDTEEKSSQEIRRDVLIQREHLEVVVIRSWEKLSDEIVGQLVKNLNAHVKTIEDIRLIAGPDSP